MTDVELLPLPEPFVSDLMHGDLYTPEQVRAYARANLAQQPTSVDEAAAIRAFEEYFQASSDDPYFEGELELWLTAWRKVRSVQQ